MRSIGIDVLVVLGIWFLLSVVFSFLWGVAHRMGWRGPRT